MMLFLVLFLMDFGGTADVTRVALVSPYLLNCDLNNHCNRDVIICPSNVDECRIICMFECKELEIYSGSRNTTIECYNSACESTVFSCGKYLPDINPSSVTIDDMLGSVDSCRLDCMQSASCSDMNFQCTGDIECMIYYICIVFLYLFCNIDSIV